MHDYQTINSPIGLLLMVATADHLVRIERLATAVIASTWHEASNPVLEQAKQELDEYFQGTRIAFSTPFAAHGTDFQMQVWQALSEIGYGQTLSYSDIASRIGRPRAVRAVGAAIGANPLLIRLPCHRVVGKTGALTGFSAGLMAKEWLLNHEQPKSG